MGLLDSLGQILPYAIPAAAGAALGGPGLAMVGAGGAAQAQTQNLDKQLQIANLLNESQYRNADLGLRRQEIQSNEQLRKLSLAQSGQEHQATLTETHARDQEHAAEHAQAQAQALQIHNDLMAQHQEVIGLQQQIAAERNQETKDRLTEQRNHRITGQVEWAKGKTQEAAEQAWKDAGWRNSPFWGVDHDSFVKAFKQKHTLDFLPVTDPQILEDAGADPDIVSMAKDRQAANQRAAKLSAPKSPSASPSPSEKLKSAAKGGGGAAATFKTSMPDTPPGHAYHVNGKAYVVKGGMATEVPNG